MALTCQELSLKITPTNIAKMLAHTNFWNLRHQKTEWYRFVINEPLFLVLQ